MSPSLSCPLLCCSITSSIGSVMSFWKGELECSNHVMQYYFYHYQTRKFIAGWLVSNLPTSPIDNPHSMNRL